MLKSHSAFHLQLVQIDYLTKEIQKLKRAAASGTFEAFDPEVVELASKNTKLKHRLAILNRVSSVVFPYG